MEQHGVDAGSRSTSPLQQQEEHSQIARGGNYKKHAVGYDGEQMAVVEPHVQWQFCGIFQCGEGRVFREKLACVVIVIGHCH